MRRKRYRRRKGYRNRGFTLIESLIIVIVIGIVSLIAAPSFGNMFDAMRLNHSVAEMRTTLSSAQRAAIRNQEACSATILINHTAPQIESGVYTSCLPEGGKTLEKNVLTATNMLSELEAASSSDTEETSKGKDKDKEARDEAWCAKHPDKQWHHKCNGEQADSTEPIRYADSVFSKNGSLNFDVSESQNVTDSTGKLVLFSRGKEHKAKKCIAISRRLGLTRVGTYSGELDPSGITAGECSALDWQEQ